MNENFWQGFEKQAIWGAVVRGAGSAIKGVGSMLKNTKGFIGNVRTQGAPKAIGKAMWNNKMTTVGAGFTAYDVGSSAVRGQEMANASKSMAKSQAGTNF